jgi:hypothetical protein
MAHAQRPEERCVAQRTACSLQAPAVAGQVGDEDAQLRRSATSACAGMNPE